MFPFNETGSMYSTHDISCVHASVLKVTLPIVVSRSTYIRYLRMTINSLGKRAERFFLLFFYIRGFAASQFRNVAMSQCRNVASFVSLVVIVNTIQMWSQRNCTTVG